ncbi:predicted protein [Listeria monocytogenes FSL N1-017]|nr:predicted protein [Listeria monocytogenes FSL N1-017]
MPSLSTLLTKYGINALEMQNKKHVLTVFVRTCFFNFYSSSSSAKNVARISSIISHSSSVSTGLS